jgi:hypothetical protein
MARQTRSIGARRVMVFSILSDITQLRGCLFIVELTRNCN